MTSPPTQSLSHPFPFCLVPSPPGSPISTTFNMSGVCALLSTSTASIPGPWSSLTWEAIASRLPFWLPYSPAPKPGRETLYIHQSEDFEPLLKALQWSELCLYSWSRTTRTTLDLGLQEDLTSHLPTSLTTSPTTSPPSFPTFTCGCSRMGGRLCPHSCTVGSFRSLRSQLRG